MFLRAATEAQWPLCPEPRRMIKVVQRRGSGRKLRLVTAAAARLVWEQLAAGELRGAVEACEGRADGLIGQAVLDQHRRRLYDGYLLRGSPPGQRRWAGHPATRGAFALAFATTYPDGSLRALAGNRYWGVGVESRGEQVAALVRDVFGNPFRPVAFPTDWRTDTAVAIARQMYDSRDFSAMPILADALQDAGCDSADVLDHCRDANGVHVRGCWVVDLVLGKE